jgi:heptosyltransferase III
MKRILVIALPGIGDAFLATPLVSSLKRAYPGASVDMLVRDGKSIAECNPDVCRVLVQERRPPLLDSVKLLAGIFRRYDLAVSTSTTDRAFISLLFAAPNRIGKIASRSPKNWWKRKLVRHYVKVDPDMHINEENLRLADALGIERCHTAVLPRRASRSAAEIPDLPFVPLATAYAVAHMKPGAVLRQWPDEYWQVVFESLSNRGIAVALTGGASEAERAYVESIMSRASATAGGAPICNLAGMLRFHEVAGLIQHAAIFVGTDTSTTHVAAATGVPTIALFGPTDVVRWGPWPRGAESVSSPWRRSELSQTHGNVTIQRTPCSCSPTQQICMLRPGMPGACMIRLLPEAVLATIDGLLDQRSAAPAPSKAELQL